MESKRFTLGRSFFTRAIQPFDDLSVSLLDKDTKYKSKQIKKELLTDDIIVEGTLVERKRSEFIMAQCCLRATLTALHIMLAIGAGFYCVYSLVAVSVGASCLSYLVDFHGDPIHSVNGLPTLCNSAVYSMGALFAINILMCLTINCCWNHSCIALFFLTLTMIFVAVTTLFGSTLTVYYMVWCDSLQQFSKGKEGSISCLDAAKAYDSRNISHSSISMVSYKAKLEIQQISVWAQLPLSLFAALMYAILLSLNSRQDFLMDNLPSGQFRYVIMQEETTPLIQNDVRIYPSNHTNHSAENTSPPPPHSASPSTNPFD